MTLLLLWLKDVDDIYGSRVVMLLVLLLLMLKLNIAGTGFKCI